MGYISTRMHGVSDYLLGSILILTTWVQATNSHEAAFVTSLVFGSALILNSLLTDFEWGAVNLFTMPFHLWIDLMAGLHLAAAPWFFDFSQIIYVPHVLTGVALMIGGLLTDAMPSYGPSTPRAEKPSVSQPNAARSYMYEKNPDLATYGDVGVSSHSSQDKT